MLIPHFLFSLPLMDMKFFPPVFCYYRQHCSKSSYPWFSYSHDWEILQGLYLEVEFLLKVWIVQSCKILDSRITHLSVCGRFYSHEWWNESLLFHILINTGYCQILNLCQFDGCEIGHCFHFILTSLLVKLNIIYFLVIPFAFL